MKNPQNRARKNQSGPPGWVSRHHRALGLAGAFVAVSMSVLWLVVVPDKAAETSGLQEIAIRWGHPACWALLAVVGLLVAVDAPKRARDVVGFAAAGCYAAFIAGVLL